MPALTFPGVCVVCIIRIMNYKELQMMIWKKESENTDGLKSVPLHCRLLAVNCQLMCGVHN